MKRLTAKCSVELGEEEEGLLGVRGVEATRRTWLTVLSNPGSWGLQKL